MWRRSLDLREYWNAQAMLRDGQTVKSTQPSQQAAKVIRPEDTFWAAGDEGTPLRLSLLEEALEDCAPKITNADRRSKHPTAFRQHGPVSVARRMHNDDNTKLMTTDTDQTRRDKLEAVERKRMCFGDIPGLCVLNRNFDIALQISVNMTTIVSREEKWNLLGRVFKVSFRLSRFAEEVRHPIKSFNVFLSDVRFAGPAVQFFVIMTKREGGLPGQYIMRRPLSSQACICIVM